VTVIIELNCSAADKYITHPISQVPFGPRKSAGRKTSIKYPNIVKRVPALAINASPKIFT